MRESYLRAHGGKVEVSPRIGTGKSHSPFESGGLADKPQFRIFPPHPHSWNSIPLHTRGNRKTLSLICICPRVLRFTPGPINNHTFPKRTHDEHSLFIPPRMRVLRSHTRAPASRRPAAAPKHIHYGRSLLRLLLPRQMRNLQNRSERFSNSPESSLPIDQRYPTNSTRECVWKRTEELSRRLGKLTTS